MSNSGIFFLTFVLLSSSLFTQEGRIISIPTAAKQITSDHYKKSTNGHIIGDFFLLPHIESNI